jgi:hypothetical protein
MHALIVYESIYGNTHAIADRIAAALRSQGEVRVLPVGDATDDQVAWADLVIVGGPTHAHGMSRSNSRKGAHEAATKPGSQLVLDASGEGPGIREWLETLHDLPGKPAAAFDTRIDGPALFTGRASTGIARGLRRHGFDLVAEPESFLVTVHNQLVPGEVDRAMRWAVRLAAVPVAAV